jgi:hypothetical protein
MPIHSLHEIYNSSYSTYTCPYCGTKQLIYSSKCDKMLTNKGIDKNEIYKTKVTLKDKLDYTE